MRIAVVGAGIAGLGCAWLLDQRHEVTLYEAQPRPGGHANTVDVPWRGACIPADTGFLVYNEPSYPNLTRLFAHLGVPTRPSSMTFAVSLDDGAFEYAGGAPRALFAQARNLFRPAFYGMLADIARFNRDAQRFLAAPGDAPDVDLAGFLSAGRYGRDFRRMYLLPMAAAIWSASLAGIMAFPARACLGFFANHGLLSPGRRLPWRTVQGGSRVYVEKLVGSLRGEVRTATPVARVRRQEHGVDVDDAQGGRARFDQVVLACHADQALALLERPTRAEAAILGAFGYQANRAVLHRDPALMPRRWAAWASWNYIGRSGQGDRARVSVTYWLNRLQGIDGTCQLFVSLNPLRRPAPERTVAELTYEHPQFTARALTAQARLPEIQGRERVWFCGAHWGHGFHEDGLRSGFEVAAALGVAPPWWREEPALAEGMYAVPVRPAGATAGAA